MQILFPSSPNHSYFNSPYSFPSEVTETLISPEALCPLFVEKLKAAVLWCSKETGALYGYCINDNILSF